jgi:hypothetical protein
MASVLFDWESIKNRILTSLSSKSEHANVFSDSALIKFIEAIAEEQEYEVNYQEKNTLENNWGLAQNKSSLLTESKVHGYNPSRKTGASGYIKYGVSESFDTMPSKNVDLPKFTQFSDGANIAFVSTTNETLTTGSTSVSVPVIQGTAQTVTFIATGVDNETFDVEDDSIENGTYELYVNDVLWTKVDTLYDYEEDDQVYLITNLANFSGIRLGFGNNINGKQLSVSDVVVFKYVQTLGEDGDILGSDVVTSVDSAIYYTDGTLVPDNYCTNDSALTGGTDTESIEQIRIEAPRVYQTGDRCGGKEDYETLLEQISFVKKASVWGADEINEDAGNSLWTYITTTDNLVYTAILTTADTGVSDSQKTSIINILNSKKPPTDIVTFPEIDIVYLIFTVDAKAINSSYTLTQVATNIETALSTAYDLDNIDFYESLYESDYIALIDGVAGVKYHDTTIEFRKNYDFDSSSYNISIDLPMYPLTGTSIEIYVKLNSEEDSAYTLIGTGDAGGDLSPESGYTFSVGSTVDTSTGIGSLEVTSGLSEAYNTYDIRIIWTIPDADLELTNRAHIFSYDSSDITVEYARTL